MAVGQKFHRDGGDVPAPRRRVAARRGRSAHVLFGPLAGTGTEQGRSPGARRDTNELIALAWLAYIAAGAEGTRTHGTGGAPSACVSRI